MSTYVLSDIHGCYEEFMEMLETIQFNDYDTLYVLGDVCDRGPKPMEVMKYLLEHQNIHLIFGNHDAWFAKYIPLLIRAKKNPSLLYYEMDNGDLNTWLYRNGGLITMDAFMDLDDPVCYDINLYLENPIYYKELSIQGKNYLLVHAGLGNAYRPGTRLSEIPVFDLIWSHIGLEDNPLEDTTMIVGHYPTFLYGKEYAGKIAHGKIKHILHIDCGCVYGGTLACVRLEDGEEFYVSSHMPKVF